MNRMKKITITAGLALALTVGLGTTAKSAWAGYLGAQTPVTAGTTGSFNVQYSTTTGDTFYQSYTNASSFGNTIPNPLPSPSNYGKTGSVSNFQVNQNSAYNGSALPANATFYNASGLDLQSVASMTQSYNAGAYAGQLLTQVFKVGSGAAMGGANPGELVFTYQFDVTSESPQSGPTNVTLSVLNNPLTNGAYLLGGGFNSTNGQASGLSVIGNSVNSSLPTSAVPFSLLTGSVAVDSSNGTIVQEQDTWGSPVLVGYDSPQIFLATNAYTYSIGNFGFDGVGGGTGAATFVPGTPEPSTLVLLGSGLGLLAFMALRRRENGLTI
ncbi:MAG: PEP-CTERM sorting domain-containing protein [Leptospirillum sp.]